MPSSQRRSVDTSPQLVILVPMFNDWDCIEPLLAGLKNVSGLPSKWKLVVVDDGSTSQMPLELSTLNVPVEVIRLGANVGHQRAIAIGLVMIARAKEPCAVIVMDADGEDRPHDCGHLWRAHCEVPTSLVVAQRVKRSESAKFKFFYGLYRWIFRVLTGRKLDFGNFSLIPEGALQRLVLMPELWNHYPATIMKSRLEVCRVPIDRGTRIAGKSRMNFIALVNHGMAGIAAFADTAYARLLAWAAAAAALLGVAIVVGVTYRLVSENPLPGWLALGATAAFIALFQIIAALIIVSFLTLSMRAQPSLPPIGVAEFFVADMFSLANPHALDAYD